MLIKCICKHIYSNHRVSCPVCGTMKLNKQYFTVNPVTLKINSIVVARGAKSVSVTK